MDEIAKLKKEIEDLKNENEKLSIELDEAKKGWSESVSYWQMAVKANEEKDAEISSIEKKYDEKIERIRAEKKKLQDKIEEMDKLIVPIMERDVKLQEELNELKGRNNK